MPGFEMKNCYKNERTGESARCLRYNPRKHRDVSDVSCLSKCEAERSISYKKAKNYTEVTYVSTFMVLDLESEMDLGV